MAGSNFFRFYIACLLVAFVLHCWVAFSHLFIYEQVIDTREHDDVVESESLLSLSMNNPKDNKNLHDYHTRAFTALKPDKKTDEIYKDNLKFCYITKGKYNILEKEETGIEYLYKPLKDDLKNYEKRILSVKDDQRQFFIQLGNDTRCLKEGSFVNQSVIEKKCVCLNNWHGNSCSIPDVVWYSNIKLVF